jgi:hypothetical protein
MIYVRTYTVGVLSLRQSGTLHLMYAVFPRVARKNRIQTIGKYHAAAGKSAASGTLWVMLNNATP